MLPPGHVAVGYLAFSLLRRAWHGDVPSDVSIPWLVVGSQVPDLIDKPLAWSFGILSSSRSLAHSLLFAVPLVLLVDHWLRRRNRSAAGEGFAVGYLSHLATDAIPALRDGPEWVTFLVWPLLAPPQYASRPPLWPPSVYFSSAELAVGIAVAVLWIADGLPGLGYAQSVRNRLLNR
ncbi:metal-dependent hydrolase [Natrinema amylolyticum]|uniref:metal-dependent hydrolase n=1 Tax=Natrinema amylolyticum TaxID=2878679 RepID=UPI001CF9D03D|nr:metal-dependent hydrolase [Natrinema amylolyticum]